MNVATTRSKIWRRISLSRKRPSRFAENVEWCGTLSSRSSLQNQRYARCSATSLAQPALVTNGIAVTDQKHPDHQLGIDRGPADLAVHTWHTLTPPGVKSISDQ